MKKNGKIQEITPGPDEPHDEKEQDKASADKELKALQAHDDAPVNIEKKSLKKPIAGGKKKKGKKGKKGNKVAPEDNLVDRTYDKPWLKGTSKENDQSVN